MLWRSSLMALVTLTTTTADGEEQEASAVPTFECLGLYYNSETERGTVGFSTPRARIRIGWQITTE